MKYILSEKEYFRLKKIEDVVEEYKRNQLPRLDTTLILSLVFMFILPRLDTTLILSLLFMFILGLVLGVLI